VYQANVQPILGCHFCVSSEFTANPTWGVISVYQANVYGANVNGANVYGANVYGANRLFTAKHD